MKLGVVVRWLAWTSFLALLILSVRPAFADSFGLDEAGNFAVLGSQSVIINSCTSIIGDVGIGGGSGALEKCTVTGTVFVATGATPDIHTKDFFATGGILTGQNLSDAIEDAQTASTALAALAATQTFSSITTNKVITGNGGQNVIHVGSVNLNGNKLTLSGGPNDLFIFDVTGGSFGFSQSQIVLLGGVTEPHVIFNLTGTGTTDLNKSTSVFFGTLLAPQWNVTVHNPFSYNGAVIGANLDIHSDADISGPHPPVPEPSSILLLGTGLAAVAAKIRRRRKA